MRRISRSYLGPAARGYRALWLASLVSIAGTWLSVIGLQLELYARTHSTVWTAAVFIAEYAPPVVVGVLFANRLSRALPRQTMIAANLASAVASAALVVVHEPVAMLACAVCSALAAATIVPVATGVVAQLVADEQLEEANAALSAVDSASTLIGESLGGIVYALIGTLTFLLNAASFVLSALCLLRLPSLPHPDVEARSVWEQLRHGADTFRHTGSRFLAVWPLVALPVGATAAVTIPLVLGRGGSQAVSGLALAAIAVGIVAGAPLATYLNTRHRRVAPMIAVGLMGISFAGVGVAPLWGIFVGQFATGVGNVVALVAVKSRVQRSVAPGEIAGFVALLVAVMGAFLSLGSLVGGIMATVASPAATFVACGVMLGLLALIIGPQRLPETGTGEPSDASAAQAGAPQEVS